MNWTLRERMLAVGVGAVALIMLIIPVVRFNDPKPARFGWHMFSAVVLPPDFFVVDVNGEEEQVFPGSYMPLVRGDLPIAEVFPGHLCEQLDDVVAVILRSETASERIPCL